MLFNVSGRPLLGTVVWGLPHSDTGQYSLRKYEFIQFFASTGDKDGENIESGRRPDDLGAITVKQRTAEAVAP